MRRKSSVTIADVAEAAGVSRAAVSKVIRNAYGVSDDMRTRVQSAIDELGYRPSVAARAMRGASYTIGIEIPNTANPFFERVLDSLTAALAQTSYRVIIALAETEVDSTRAIQTLIDHQVDGILAIGSKAPAEWLEVQGSLRPFVLLGRHEPSANYDTVVDDDALGTRQVMTHLHDLGHRRIAHLTIQSSRNYEMARSSHAVRSRAYTEEMTRLGLEQHQRVLLVDPTEDAAHARTLALLDDDDRPTAIYAGHDELALGVLRAVADRGLAATDMSVVGYDDSKIASHPLISLTTVRQSATHIGSVIGRLLLERINGRTEPVHEVITPELQVRRSSTSPRQQPSSA